MKPAHNIMVSKALAILAALAPFTAGQARDRSKSDWNGHSRHDVLPKWTRLPGSVITEAWGFCPAASWPPSDVGERIVPQAADAELKAMLDEVDPDRIENYITKLVSFGTRHLLSQRNSSTRGIGAARDWIYQEMLDFAEPSDGAMEVYYDSYIQGVAERVYFPVNVTNVVARINGTEDSNRTYVVTGHYDSRALDIADYTGDAPGADDDASGVAVLMEMARVVAKMGRPKATMMFVATSGEEQGLYGSAHLAQTLKNNSVNVEGNWNVDTVGTGKNEPYYPINDYTIRLFAASIFYPNYTGIAALERRYALIGGWNDSPAQQLGRYIAEVAAGALEAVQMQVKLMYRPDRYLRGGDHLSFLEQGFPAVRFTEPYEDFKHQHQNVRVADGGVQYGDLLRYVDFDFTARVARVNLASMWSAANAPGMPQEVGLSYGIGTSAASEETPLEVLSNDSRLFWRTGDDSLVSSYEVVYRPSGSLQWTHAVDVGVSGNVTLGLSKDNFQLGVRAVGADGKKSPAVFPLPVDML
ncbi:hypothetical protein B0A50_01809 [Salinomyces thailandicus]|uniref:Peptide hydrolase n=1 Tax=Salinomyces thailandicus TaxID=706561 RepID=A0A4U0U8U1_9PEZI|nr:hypothetical protein B0A50_01809 [Salinomyces thailandica]